MTRVPEFNTIFPRTDGAQNIYHDQSACLVGKSVKPEHRRYGSAGWAKCQTCHEIDVKLTGAACSERRAPWQVANPISTER